VWQKSLSPLPSSIKGGVGKTTTTINLGASLAAKGQRVLVVDVDPQGTATIATVGQAERGTAEILGYGAEEDEVANLVATLIRRSEAYAVDVIGSNFGHLNHQEIALTSSPMLMVRFVEMIEALAGRYDYVLFDCPPALRSLTTATMYAADHVLLVVEPSKESIDGLGNLLSYLAGLRRWCSASLRSSAPSLPKQIRENGWSRTCKAYSRAVAVSLGRS
jgi:chromosome partitioning protein